MSALPTEQQGGYIVRSMSRRNANAIIEPVEDAQEIDEDCALGGEHPERRTKHVVSTQMLFINQSPIVRIARCLVNIEQTVCERVASLYCMGALDAPVDVGDADRRNRQDEDEEPEQCEKKRRITGTRVYA